MLCQTMSNALFFNLSLGPVKRKSALQELMKPIVRVLQDRTFDQTICKVQNHERSHEKSHEKSHDKSCRKCRKVNEEKS